MQIYKQNKDGITTTLELEINTIMMSRVHE